MDDLITQLRSTQHEGSETPDIEEDRDVPLDVPQGPSNSREAGSTLFDPTSSQTQAPFQILKLNFELLKKTKERTKASVGSVEVKKSKDYRIEGRFVALIKRIDRYSGEVARLELVDGDGTVQGSSLLDTVNKVGLRVGSIVILSGCSLWKAGENHLNLVRESIEEVV
jgi:hypothetical protein